MFPEQRNAIRVGLWVLAAAAVAGLLVLVLHGGAHAAETTDLDAAARALAEREPPTAAERLARADAVLREERQRQRHRLYSDALDSGWRLTQRASPRSAFRAARRMFGAVSELWERSPAEDDALELLEVGRGSGGSTDAVLEARYQELRARERRHLAELSFERAFETERPSLARLRLERSLELDPELERARAHLERLDRDDGFASLAGARPVSLALAAVSHDSEVALAAALLGGDYDRALELEPRTAGDVLAVGVAQYLGGHRGAARATFESLAELDDAVGETARRWAERPELDPESALARAWQRYRTERALGWIGGWELVDRGFDTTPEGYRAWRESLTPLNLALSLPWRAYTDWRPDGRDLRAAADRYLELSPGGPRAAEARDLLDAIQPVRPREWDDGRFVLPRARTAHPRLMPEPLLVTRQALAQVAADAATLAALDGAAALMLVPTPRAGHTGLAPERAASLLGALALGIEAGELQPLGSSRDDALDAMRRLDEALGRGVLEVSARPWSDGRDLGELGYAFLEGDSTSSVRAYRSERDGSEVRIARRLDADAPACPEGVACIHRTPAVDGAVYAEVDDDAELRVGAYTTLDHARIALQVGSRGPQASLVVPVGRWLGIGRWLPLEAHVDLGTERIGFAPRLGPIAK